MNLLNKIKQSICKHKNMMQTPYEVSFLIRGNRVYKRIETLEAECYECGYTKILEVDNHYSREYWDGQIMGKIIRKGRVVGVVKDDKEW